MTDFTTECAPVDRPTRESAILALLSLQPVFEADIVDIADTATAFADGEKWILDYVGTVPAETTESVIVIRAIVVNWCCWSGLYFFLLLLFLGLFLDLLLLLLFRLFFRLRICRLFFGFGGVGRDDNIIGGGSILFLLLVTLFAAFVLAGTVLRNRFLLFFFWISGGCGLFNLLSSRSWLAL